MNIKKCNNCGIILETSPSIRAVNGVCTACINVKSKLDINFLERQEWLTNYILENKTNEKYDCLVAVSGGKDSTVIVRKLFENHGIEKALLVHITDDFTHTETGKRNLNNIIQRYNCDLLTYKVNPAELSRRMKLDFETSLNPLRFLEEQIYSKPLEIARMHNIKLVFYGENPYFEYGAAETLEVFHSATNEDLKAIYLGAIYPYSAPEWFKLASEVGFVDLNYLNEWQRHGQIENYSQIDSIGYSMGIWTKFVKFGFQRVSDISCRLVRDGLMTYEQAQQLISEQDYICDPAAKRDFCRAIEITEEYFDSVVDKHANKKLVTKDINGRWRRIDLL